MVAVSSGRINLCLPFFFFLRRCGSVRWNQRVPWQRARSVSLTDLSSLTHSSQKSSLSAYPAQLLRPVHSERPSNNCCLHIVRRKVSSPQPTTPWEYKMSSPRPPFPCVSPPASQPPLHTCPSEQLWPTSDLLNSQSFRPFILVMVFLSIIQGNYNI